MPPEDLNAIRRLQALMDITRVVSSDESIASVLDAIAHVLTETVRFAGVVINVYRPQFDDYEAATVVGPPEMREQLLGATYDASWIHVILDERFHRRGAYFVPEGSLDWESAAVGARWMPEPEPEREDPGAWRPGDELFVPCRDSDGHMLAVISLGAPVSGPRACGTELDFLVVSAATRRSRSSRRTAPTRQAGTAPPSSSCSRCRRSSPRRPRSSPSCRRCATASSKRSASRRSSSSSSTPPAGCLRRRRRWAGRRATSRSGRCRWTRSPWLLDPAFEIGGCYLIPYADAVARTGHAYADFGSRLHGRGPRAWDRHRLFVPLRDATGAVVGRIWADEPEDRLLPSRARLEALALFAGQATMAIVSAGQLEQLRVLADQDPLTGLANRRAFMRELEHEVERARRYGHPLTLAIGDVDRFKQINDTHGHPAGDRALCVVADTLRAGLRANDGAFRLGGDKFALLLPETTREETAEVVRRLYHGYRDTAPEPFADLRMSAGFATLPADGGDAESLIRHADAALYEFKRRRAEDGALAGG